MSKDEKYFQDCLRHLAKWYKEFGGKPEAFEALRSIYLSILAFRLLEMDEPNFEDNLDETLSAHRQHVLDRLPELRKEFKDNRAKKGGSE